VVLLQVTDLVMMDLKHLDSAKHRIATGVPNDLILANARRLAPMGIPLIFRVPVVPTVNDRDAEIAAIARFVQELEKVRTGAAERVNEWAAPITLELLSFHRLASDKYRSLGLDYRARELPTLSRERMKELTAIARACGATVVGNG
jgi:pyruvate formate lyase activating enzyme